MFDFRVVTQWVDATLHQYLPASLVTTTEFVLVGVCYWSLMQSWHSA